MKRLLVGFITLTSLIHSLGLEDPKEYAKNSNLQWNWAVQALNHYSWKGKERVLDLGSGDGKITALLAKSYTEGMVVGFDVSKAMVEFASTAYSLKEYPSLLFQEGDMTRLPFQGQFDIVLSFCSLHYVKEKEQEQTLRKIHQSLVEGGDFLVLVPGKDKANLGDVSEPLIQSDKWKAHFPSFEKKRFYHTKESFEALLTKCGFEVESFEVIRDLVSFQNQEELKSWLRPLLNYTNHLSKNLQEEFLTDLSVRMIELALPVEDDSVLLESHLFECLSRKSADKK